MRPKEHKKDLKQLEGVTYTRARRKESLTEIHKSTLMDHVVSKNHTIDREGVRLPAKELYLLGDNTSITNKEVLVLSPITP